MATEKMTKIEMFAGIRDYISGETMDCTVEEAVDFLDKQIEQLKAKAEKAKSRAAIKKVNGDPLREAVFQCVGEKPQTIDEITSAVVDSGIDNVTDITKAKVTARLTHLVKNGSVVKEQTKVGARKIMTYALAKKRIEVETTDASLADTEPEVTEDNEVTEE